MSRWSWPSSASALGTGSLISVLKKAFASTWGHALSVKAADGCKATNDPIDAHKIAILLRRDMLPKPISIPLQCAPRATSPDAGCIRYANGLSCWLVSKTLTAGIISPVSLRH